MERAIHAFVMAGGNGNRLRPLTDRVCKPALPFGPDHRVIDFVLANLRNAGVRRVQVLVQHQPTALMAHVQQRWAPAAGAALAFGVRLALPRGYPAGRSGPPGYLGTADAVHQNLVLGQVPDSDLVAVFGADHVYRMDLRQMVLQHRASGADVSVAALPLPVGEASAFGVVETDPTGRVVAFHEKPHAPVAMPARSTHALVSMGNYLFSAGVLKTALAACCGSGRFDFGHDVLPFLLPRCHIQAYDFQSHNVPGLAPGEDPHYWRDVGTLDAYFQAHMDTLGPTPLLALDNALWPLSPPGASQPPAASVHEVASSSRIGAGAVVDTATLDRVVVGAGARVLAGARVSRCVLFEGVTVGAGARLQDVIVAQGNTVPAGERIGFDPCEDRARFFHSPGGVLVVPPHHFPSDGAPAPEPAHAGQGPAHRVRRPALNSALEMP